MKPVLTIGLALAALLAGAALSGDDGVGLEHRFIYFPSARLVGTPGDLGLPFEEARFGPGGRLHGWFVPGAGPSTLVWFHGNAGNISHRLEWLQSVRDGLGAHVFIFDYGGYGLSGGRPSEASTYRDARAALAYLRGRADVDRERIVYYGKSLGGAVAIQLATEEPPHCLIVQSSFTSMPDLARLHYPFIPAGLFPRTRYSSIDKIGQVRAPVLVAHGDRDEVAPVGHARQLYEAAPEPKRLVIVEGARHNDVLPVGGRGYLDALREFCATLPPP